MALPVQLLATDNLSASRKVLFKKFYLSRKNHANQILFPIYKISSENQLRNHADI